MHAPQYLRYVEGTRAMSPNCRSSYPIGKVAGEISPDELQKQASKLDPKLGEAVGKMRAGGSTTLAAALIITLAVIHSCKLDAKLNLNRVVDQVIEVLDLKSVPKGQSKSTSEE
jgi:hypothetical protein